MICTNPVATVPNRANVVAALEKAELVIAQDVFLDNETNRYAHILLPGALWAEADGVMINSERNMTLMRRAVTPPGEAMPDWQIVARVASAMGYGQDFAYASAAEVFDEIARAHNPKVGYDIRGASHARLRETPLQWPCPPDDAADRHPIRYLNDGVSQTGFVTAPDGTACRGSPSRRRAAAPASTPAPACRRPRCRTTNYPFAFNTGRLPHQWHTMTKTGKIAALNKLNPEPVRRDSPARRHGARHPRPRPGRDSLAAAVPPSSRPS